MARAQTVTWRDDDISEKTSLEELREVDDHFQLAGVTHTIAVMAAGLERRPDLVNFILVRKMDVQLHCWKHDDLTVDGQALRDIEKAFIQIEVLFGKPPAVLYPPWNRTSSAVEVYAHGLGLVVSNFKISLEAFIRADGDVREKVVNFHYWAEHERALIPKALEMYNRRRQ